MKLVYHDGDNGERDREDLNDGQIDGKQNQEQECDCEIEGSKRSPVENTEYRFTKE